MVVMLNRKSTVSVDSIIYSSSPSGDFVDGTGGTGDTEFGPSDIDADKP